MSEVKLTAARIAKETLLGCLPKDVPPFFVSIDRAAYDGRNTIVASLTMFDGALAIVRFSRWRLGWSYSWDLLPGGALSYESTRWVRIASVRTGHLALEKEGGE